jgi:hypothetical protein
MRKWIGWVLVVGLVVILGVGLASLLLAKTNSGQAAQKNVETPAVTAIFQQSQQQKLMNPGVDLPARESLMEKIEIQNRLEENENAGQVSPASKDAAAGPGPAAMLASSQVETGIFEGSEGMVRTDQAHIQNYWRGLIDGKVDMLMAGATAANKDQGLVVLVVASLDPSDSSVTFEYFNSPGKTGSLRVVGAQDNLVALQTSVGETLQFDVKNKIFVK